MQLALSQIALTTIEQSIGEGAAEAADAAKAALKTPDAKTTRKQELGSAYIFGYALKYRKSGWKTEFDLMRDERMMKGLRKLYPEVEDTDWLTVYFKQHKVILDKFSKSDINRFDHSGTNSFMKFISDVVKENFGVRKKIRYLNLSTDGDLSIPHIFL